jgi:hypothetical protein
LPDTVPIPNATPPVL